MQGFKVWNTEIVNTEFTFRRRLSQKCFPNFSLFEQFLSSILLISAVLHYAAFNQAQNYLLHNITIVTNKAIQKKEDYCSDNFVLLILKHILKYPAAAIYLLSAVAATNVQKDLDITD